MYSIHLLFINRKMIILYYSYIIKMYVLQNLCRNNISTYIIYTYNLNRIFSKNLYTSEVFVMS